MSWDPRHDQVAVLSLFLMLGWVTRDWTVNPWQVAMVLGTCLSVQWILSGRSSTQLPGWPSALITGLSLSLLLRAHHLPTLVLAATAAIASKFFWTVGRKHIFNPANLGIIAALTLTNDAWISPAQWGSDLWIVLIFVACAGMVLGKVGRWDTSLIFLGSYAGLEVIRNLWVGWPWDVVLHHCCSGSLWLFALFMLSDPRSIPNARSSRILWAFAIAALTLQLRYGFHLPAAPFWSLFIVSLLTPGLDYLWSAPRFTWIPTPARSV